MPNYCEYEMKIKGSKKAIERVINCLKQDYNYSKCKPSHKHFFRVFECFDDEEFVKNEDGTFTKFVWGDCAWSVHSCMLKGQNTYYDSVKNDFPNIFMGTDLEEQSKDCEIEVFSEEEGCAFSEHYIFKNGKCLLDDCVKTEQAGYTKKGKITKRINWETYEGEYVCLNPHRVAPNELYRWEI